MGSLRKKINQTSSKYLILHRTKKEEVLAFIAGLKPYTINVELVRLGAENDGGYLLPDDFDGIEACFSPGVERMSQFEEVCFHKGMKLFLMDKSIEAPNLPNDVKFHFTKKFIGATIDNDFTTMDAWVAGCDVSDKSDLLLQMDIEGFEYVSILNMTNALLNRFRIINIEFHDIDKIWNPEFLKTANAVFEKLMQTHTCVHIHPNNNAPLTNQLGVEIPAVLEFTYYRNDRITQKKPATIFPHPLDCKNKHSEADIILPKIWYDSE